MLNTNSCIFSIDGFSHVIQAGSPENDASRPSEACESEEEEEETIQNHSNVLPVLHHLIVLVIVPDVLSYELNSCQRHLHLRAELVRR